MSANRHRVRPTSQLSGSAACGRMKGIWHIQRRTRGLRVSSATRTRSRSSAVSTPAQYRRSSISFSGGSGSPTDHCRSCVQTFLFFHQETISHRSNFKDEARAHIKGQPNPFVRFLYRDKSGSVDDIRVFTFCHRLLLCSSGNAAKRLA